MKGVENTTNMILICRRVKNWCYKWFLWLEMSKKNKAKRGFKIQISQELTIKGFEVQTTKEWSLFVVLKFKRVRKEAKVVLKCKWVKEWSTKGFKDLIEWRMKL